MKGSGLSFQLLTVSFLGAHATVVIHPVWFFGAAFVVVETLVGACVVCGIDGRVFQRYVDCTILCFPCFYP